MRIERFAFRKSLALAMIAASFIGCSPLETRSPVHMANPFTPLSMEGRTKIDEEKDLCGVPETMAVIWTDSVYTAPGAQPTRGFGGRFYFYNAQGETIRVNGELSVFGFDDTTDMTQSKVPQKKFVYPADQLQSHASITDLGISYSFWIPWDAVGGDRKAISLLPIFRTPEGKLVRGEQTINVLPGRTNESSVSTSSTVNVIRNRMQDQAIAVAYTEGQNGVFPQGGSAQNNAAIDPYYELRQRTSTIDVPRDLARSLQGTQGPRSATQPQGGSYPAPQQPSASPNTNTSSRLGAPQSYAPQGFASQATMSNGNHPAGPNVTHNAGHRHGMMPQAHAMPQQNAMPPAGYQPPAQQPNRRQDQERRGGMPPATRPTPTLPPTAFQQGSTAIPADIPFPAQTFDPSTGTMTGIGPAPGFRNSSSY